MSTATDDGWRVQGRGRVVSRRARPAGDRAAGPPPAPPVLDIEHLRGFTGGDAELERELGELFLSTADAYLGRMSRALEASDDDWSAAAHALKGASANLGASRLAGLAAAAEAAPPDAGVLATLRREVDDVRARFERV